MPSTATITAHYTFSAGTRASANQVTNNFANLRGHFIPIDPNTSTAGQDNTWDVGSASHRWGNLYSQNLDISITSTAAMVISGLSSGGHSFKKNGTAVFQILDNGYSGANNTPMDGTTSADVAQLGLGASTLNSFYTSTGHISGSTCTIATVGRPVIVSFNASIDTFSDYIATYNHTTASSDITAEIFFIRDGVTLTGQRFGSSRSGGNSVVKGLKLPGNTFFIIDAPTAGSHIYSACFAGMASPTAVYMSYVRLTAFEF